MMHERDDETAIRHYTRVRSEYDIHSVLMTYNLGVAYLRLDRLEQAVQMFQETVRLKPDYATAYLNMGYVFYQQGQVSQAIRASSMSPARYKASARWSYMIASSSAACRIARRRYLTAPAKSPRL